MLLFVLNGESVRRVACFHRTALARQIVPYTVDVTGKSQISGNKSSKPQTSGEQYPYVDGLDGACASCSVKIKKK